MVANTRFRAGHLHDCEGWSTTVYALRQRARSAPIKVKARRSPARSWKSKRSVRFSQPFVLCGAAPVNVVGPTDAIGSPRAYRWRHMKSSKSFQTAIPAAATFLDPSKLVRIAPTWRTKRAERSAWRDLRPVWVKKDWHALCLVTWRAANSVCLSKWTLGFRFLFIKECLVREQPASSGVNHCRLHGGTKAREISLRD
jgi:hypothetical protein